MTLPPNENARRQLMCGTGTQREVCARKDGTPRKQKCLLESQIWLEPPLSGVLAEDGIPKPQPQGNTNPHSRYTQIPAGCSNLSKGGISGRDGFLSVTGRSALE